MYVTKSLLKLVQSIIKSYSKQGKFICGAQFVHKASQEGK